MELSLMDYCLIQILRGKNNGQEMNEILKMIHSLVRFDTIALEYIDNQNDYASVSFKLYNSKNELSIYEIFLDKKTQKTTSTVVKKVKDLRCFWHINTNNGNERAVLEYFLDNINFYQEDRFLFIKDSAGYVISLSNEFDQYLKLKSIVIYGTSKHNSNKSFVVEVIPQEVEKPIISVKGECPNPNAFLYQTPLKFNNPKKRLSFF